MGFTWDLWDETNSQPGISPLKIGLLDPKGNEKVFQVSIFRGDVSFREGNSSVRICFKIPVCGGLLENRMHDLSELFDKEA